MNLKGMLLFVLLVITAPAMGQFRNIMLDEQRESDGKVYAPSIAINPRHPENIVVGAGPGEVYYTKDAGATWQKGKLSSASGIAGDPVVIADPKGVFYYFYVSDPTGGKGGMDSEKHNRIVVHRSDDGGESWDPGESIGLNEAEYQYKESATVDGKGNIFVSWTQLDKYGASAADCASNILFSSSKNGRKWTEPVVISQLNGNCLDDDNTVKGAVPAVTVDGKVMIAWSNQEKIFLDRSFNGGDLWLSNDIVVTEQVGGWDMEIPGHHRSNGLPVLTTDKSKSPYRGSLYIVWADQRSGEDDTDIWFTRSHNFGDNWSAAGRVNDDGKGKHQYLPSMAVDEATGYLYVLYYDRRNYDDLQTDVYVACSADGGVSFKNVRISEKPFVPDGGEFFGDKNSISAHEGIITPVWTRTDAGKTSMWTAVIKHEDLLKVPLAGE